MVARGLLNQLSAQLVEILAKLLIIRQRIDSFGILPDNTAINEMAAASGLSLLSEKTKSDEDNNLWHRAVNKGS